jgi:hypothetical protein
MAWRDFGLWRLLLQLDGANLSKCEAVCSTSKTMEEFAMTKTLARNLLAVAALAGLFSSTAAMAAEGDRADRVPTFCSGGAQEFINGGTQNAAAAVNVAAGLQIMPFTTFAGGASGAAGDSDLYVATLSGEASGNGGGFWTAQAQVSVNGGAFFNIDPVGPNTFHQGNLAETHTMTWCRRIAATNTTVFRIVWQKFVAGNAIIDDYTMLVERSN